jgi:hypothetical protein
VSPNITMGEGGWQKCHVTNFIGNFTGKCSKKPLLCHPRGKGARGWSNVTKCHTGGGRV